MPTAALQVTGRLGSRRFTNSCMVATVRRPDCVPCTVNSSFPRDHSPTQAWFRSRLMCCSSIARWRESLPSSLFSSMTIMPSLSQASSSSGVGGLCELL